MMTLAKAIINQDKEVVQHYLQTAAPDLNVIDEFGFTPLIETAIVNNLELTKLLLDFGADPNFKDMAGGTALHWAVENNNLEMCRLLLGHKADANAYNYSSEPVLIKPLLRDQLQLKDLLYANGASAQFANDYINFKLLGHRYDLKGSVDIVDTAGHYTELDLEGFFLEFSINLVKHSLQQYTNNFATKKMQLHFSYLEKIIQALAVAAKLIQYQQYQVNLEAHSSQINQLLEQDLLIIPSNYQGHAISYICYHGYFIKCDRRKHNNMLNGIVIYKIRHPNALDASLLRRLMYELKNDQFVEEQLPKILGLELKARLMVEPQMSGNCSWANISAVVPAAHFMLLDDIANYSSGIIDYGHQSISLYRHWREWDKQNAIQYCLQSFTQAGSARKASIAALLATIFFQRFHWQDKHNLDLAKRIYRVLRTPGYEYILEHYIDIYCKQKPTSVGENLEKLINVCSEYW